MQEILAILGSKGKGKAIHTNSRTRARVQTTQQLLTGAPSVLTRSPVSNSITRSVCHFKGGGKGVLLRLQSQCSVQHYALPTKAWSCWRCCEVFPILSAVFTSSNSCSSICGLLRPNTGLAIIGSGTSWFFAATFLFSTRRVMVTPAISRRWRTAALVFSGRGSRSLWLVSACPFEDFEAKQRP